MKIFLIFYLAIGLMVFLYQVDYDLKEASPIKTIKQFKQSVNWLVLVIVLIVSLFLWPTLLLPEHKVDKLWRKVSNFFRIKKSRG